MNDRYLISEQVDKIIAATSIWTLCGDLVEKLNKLVVYKENKIKIHVDKCDEINDPNEGG